TYVFNVKQAIDDAADKLDQSDKNNVVEKCNETIKWLDNNTTAEKEEYEYRMEELTKICSPIMTKMHQQGKGKPGTEPTSCGQQAGGFGGGNYRGPTVEEVD
ncbi:major heat shock 70 kDa protein Ba-like, partial [Teleopsis dalmanni]